MQNQGRSKWGISAAAISLAFFSLVPGAYAGTIENVYKYAWGNTGGWVNFAPTMSTVTVTDSAVTGYAWSQNHGWINLSPANGGVDNDGSGNLSGHAWDETAGWVSFSGVSINTSTGKFTGMATGPGGYKINFDCTSCDVRTTWRPGDSDEDAGAAGGSTPIAPAPTGVEAPSENGERGLSEGGEGDSPGGRGGSGGAEGGTASSGEGALSTGEDFGQGASGTGLLASAVSWLLGIITSFFTWLWGMITFWR